MSLCSTQLSSSTVPLAIRCAQPYYVIFVWRVTSDTHTVEHVSQLSEYVPYPGLGLDGHGVHTAAPIIDTEREVILIPKLHGDRLPTLWVFSLASGALQQKVELYGHWKSSPLHYCQGLIAAAVAENAHEVPPSGQSTILVCDAIGDGDIIGGVHLPDRLRARERKRTNTVGGVLRPVYYAPGGTLVATSSEAYEDTMDVLRWGTADIPSFPQPDASLKLKASFADCDRMYPSCSAPFGASAFLLAVSEELAGALATGDQCQNTMYAIDWTAMAVHWRAEPVWGFVHGVWHVAALDVIVVAGKREMGDTTHTFMSLLDPSTGTLRCTETVDARVQGSATKVWALSEDADEPYVVLVFAGGSLCTVPLRTFAETGLPRDGERVRVEWPLPRGVKVEQGALGSRSVVLSVSDDSGASYLHHVRW